MEVQKVLHMKEGVGQHSYANNSHFQKSVTIEAKSVLEESINKVYHNLKPKCFMMADMGCSSSPNALLAVKEAINVVDEACQSLNCQPPEFGVFLNDLPVNDFNTLFNFIPDFYKWVEQEKGSDFGPCFVSGAPRTFYGRVFPNQFLHFVYSGCALHWLSQVPEGLVSERGVALNKGNILIAQTSPPEVEKAFYSQFKRDFTMFIRSRAKEVVPGGCMVLTFPASNESSRLDVFPELVGSTLRDMVLEGIVKEEKVDELDIPWYFPNGEQVRQLVELEGSFALNKIETSTTDWRAYTTQDLDNQAEFFARFVRATCESLMVNAFGGAIVDDFLLRFKAAVRQHLAAGLPFEHFCSVIVSMTKKT